MRQLKFRAWDKPSDIFPKGCCIYFIIGSATTFRLGDVDVIEQFTGLVDKNGVEIYEGDIYRSPHGVIGRFENLVVRYNHASFGLVRFGHNGMNPKRLGSMNNQRMGTVIGNIHENLDLLKK